MPKLDPGFGWREAKRIGSVVYHPGAQDERIHDQEMYPPRPFGTGWEWSVYWSSSNVVTCWTLEAEERSSDSSCDRDFAPVLFAVCGSRTGGRSGWCGPYGSWWTFCRHQPWMKTLVRWNRGALDEKAPPVPVPAVDDPCLARGMLFASYTLCVGCSSCSPPSPSSLLHHLRPSCACARNGSSLLQPERWRWWCLSLDLSRIQPASNLVLGL